MKVLAELDSTPAKVRVQTKNFRVFSKYLLLEKDRSLHKLLKMSFKYKQNNFNIGPHIIKRY